MQRELPRTRGGAAALTFDSKLEKEDEVLEALVLGLARNQVPADTWSKLHLAAVRDDRLAELALAYESLSNGKRLKTMPPAVVAEFFFRASTFFSDAFSDELGAIAYLERALAASPSHAASFEKIEHLLTKAEGHKKLADLCASLAPHRPRAEQPALLRRAAELYETEGTADDRIIEINQQILRIEPQDEKTRERLEARFLKANRHRDIARLLEQAMTADPPPGDAYALQARGRLIELYAGQLREPERSIPHVEALLAKDPSNEEARRVATRLLEVKGLAARAAAALAAATEETGVPGDVAKLLAIELEHTRGPKRRDVLRKIGILRQDKLDDPRGAYESFEAALALDPADDEARRRYASLASQLGKQLDASRTLGRVGGAVKDPLLRAKLAVEVGALQLGGGDVKRAKATFLGMQALPNVDPLVTLVAARGLAAIYSAEKDYPALADALEKVALAEPDPELRRIADEELAELAQETLHDTARAIGAYRRLLDGPGRARALAALEPLYEAAGDAAALGSLLDERAKDTQDPEEARRIAFRSAEVLTSLSAAPVRASEAWGRFVARFGPSRDVHQRWLPLLEAQREWAALSATLEADVALAPEPERAALWARLGMVRLQRTRELPRAIEAFERALASDPGDKTSRSALEKLLVAAGEHRLRAAAVLEPVYRAESSATGLLRVLDTKALLVEDPDARLGALEEASAIAERTDRSRALDFVRRGIAEAASQLRPLVPWLARLDALAPIDVDAKKRATILVAALAGRPITSEALFDLATRAGEALAAIGDVAAALDAYRQALAFEPTSVDLLNKVDDLLREQGDPRERIGLYRAALDRASDAARRRTLQHKIGAIQSTDLGDARGAIATYTSLLTDDPDDHAARAALKDLYAFTLQWDALLDLLESDLARVGGENPKQVRLRLATVGAAHGDPARTREHVHALLDDATLDASEIETLAAVAETIGDTDVLRAALRRRASKSGDAREQAHWMDRLALIELPADPAGAISLWKLAAKLVQAAGDDDEARRLYENVRGVAPHDGEAALHLASLLERAGSWEALPELYAVLLENTELPSARVAILMRHAKVLAEHLDDPAGALVSAAQAFELAPDSADRREVLASFTTLALLGKATHIFAQAMDGAVARLVGDGADLAAQRADLLMAKGRVLAANREGRDAAAAAYRAVLEDPGVDDGRLKSALLAFESLIASDHGDARKGDRRWLLSWKADHAREGGAVSALVAWASAEETVFADEGKALALYRRALLLDPENVEILAPIGRLSLATGDTSAAIRALMARRDRSDGVARNALDIEIATILVERTDRRDEALASIAAVLQSAPQDDAALAIAGRLLTVPATHARAVALLERACEGTDDPELHSRVLRQLLDADVNPPAARELRTTWYRRLLELHRNQGNLDLALHTALAGAGELPSEESLWDDAESLAREIGRPAEVAELYHHALAQPLARDAVLALGQRAVAFHEEWFEDAAGVVRILDRVLEIDPLASWAFDRLKLLFDATERWSELFLLFDRALASAGPGRRVELLEDAAQIAKDFANDSDRAIGYLEQLLAVRPGDVRLVGSLERMYERNGSHRELIVLLRNQLASLSPTESQRARARIALLWLDEIGDSGSALSTVEEILAQGDRGSVDVFALLEKVLAKAPAHAEVRPSLAPKSSTPAGRKRRDSVAPKSKRPSVRQRAAALLRELYSETHREADLARILEIQLEDVKATAEKVQRHRQLASLYGKLGEDTLAIEHLCSLVMLEPGVAQHRADLAEVAGKIGRYDRLAEVLAAAAEHGDKALEVELLLAASEVQATNLRDAGRAADLLLRVLALTGVSPDSALAAARRAEPLLADTGRSWERLEVLERIATLEVEPFARAAAQAAAASLATELGEHARAIAAWESRLAEGDDAAALDGLIRLLDSEKRWARLAETLDRRAGQSRPTAERRADRVLIARVQGDQLGNVKEAIRAWRAVEREFGESDETLDALARLLSLSESWSELAALLLRGAEIAQTGERRAELLERLGDLQMLRLGDVSSAISSFEAALAAHPQHRGARDGLHALLADAAHRAAVVTVLLKAFTATDEWPLVLDLTEHRLLSAPDARARARILKEVALLAEERAADAPAAFDAMRKALLEVPADAHTEAELTRLAEGTGSWSALAETYAAATARAVDPDPGWLARMHFTHGDVLENRLAQPLPALAAYKLAFERNRGDLAVARAIIRAGGNTGEWADAASVVVDASRATGRASEDLFSALESAAQSGSAWDAVAVTMTEAVANASDLPPSVARDLHARLGVWQRDRRGDPEAAEAAFASALANDNLNAELLASLAQVQRRAKGRPLIDSLLRLSQATGGDLDLLREAAEIAMGSVADRALAKSILEQLLRLAKERWAGGSEGVSATAAPSAHGPLVRWVVDELVRIHDEQGNPERSVDLLVESSRLPFPRTEAREMMLDAAARARRDLQDPERAIVIYAALYDEDPKDEAAATSLVSLYEEESRHGELLALRRRQVRGASTLDERLTLRLAAAKLEEILGDVDASVQSLQGNLADQRRHGPSATELYRVLHAHARFGELALVLSEQANLAEADGEAVTAADLWVLAAGVAEDRLGDKPRAIAYYRRVVALEPRAAALDALAVLSTQAGEPARAAEYLERLRVQADPESMQSLTLRLADALAASGNETAARARLEDALGKSPSAEAIRNRLATAYRSAEQWAALAELLASGAEHAVDKAAHLARLLEAADLFITRCRAPEKAVPLLERASDLEPNERAIRLTLADALGASQRFPEARALLRSLVDSFGGRRPKERGPVHYHLARLELKMGDRARALVELDAATRIDPGNPEILRALAELARDDGQFERAERSYRALLVALKRPEEADPGAPMARSEVLLELSRIADRQGEHERSREILESALETAARGDVEAARFESALRESGQWTTLVRALEARLARVGDAAAAVPLLSHLADVLDMQLGHVADAFAARQRAVWLQPDSREAHEAALGLARRSDGVLRYVDEVEKMVTRAEEAGETTRAADLLVRLGRVVEAELKDESRAALLFERAMQLGPATPSLEVLRALDAVYERSGDVEAQMRILAQRVEAESAEADAGARADALFRFSALLFTSPVTADDACDRLEAALALSDERERALATLKDACTRHPSNDRILALYETAARRPGYERSLVDALSRRADLPPVTPAHLREAIEVAQRIGDGALADLMLRRFIEHARSSGEMTGLAWALAALADLREGAGDIEDAVVLKREALAHAEPDFARRLRFEVAHLAAEALEDLALAADTYEGALAVEVGDREAWQPLLEVYRRMGASSRLASLLGRAADWVEDVSERSRLRLERVRVMAPDATLGEDAIPPLREILDEDPGQVDAALLLAGILERAGRSDELKQLLAAQIDAAKDRSDAGSVASLSLRLAKLADQQDGLEARAVLYAALEWAPSDRQVLEALVSLLTQEEDVSERSDVLEKLLPLETGELAERLALELSALRVRLTDPPGAERALEAGFRAYPASVVLRDRLQKAYVEAGAWGKLAELYVLDASARTDTAERIARLREAAGIYRERLSDPARAAEALRRARAVSQEDPELLKELVDVLAEKGDYADAIAELGRAIDLCASPLGDGERTVTSLDASLAPLFARRAAFRVELGDSDAALADLEHAFRYGGASFAEELAPALEKLRRRAAERGDSAGERAMCVRLAEVLLLVGKGDAARGLLSDLVKLNPRDRDALRVLARLEESTHNWEAVTSTYRRLLAVEDPSNVVETALRLADACDKAGRPADARGALERARIAAPEDETLRARVQGLYEQTGAFKELAEMALADAHAAKEVGVRFGHLVRAGALVVRQGADPSIAVTALEEAHALRPADSECTVLLADAYTLAGRGSEAVELINQAILAQKGRRSRDLGALYHRLARVAHASGDRPTEMGWLSSALDMDAQSGLVASELASVALELGHPDVAQRALRAITMMKGAISSPISRALAYQQLGEIARQQGDNKRAVMLLKRAIDDDPSLTSARQILDALQSEGA